MKKRLIYWVSQKPENPVLQKKVQLLEKNGSKVILIPSFTELIDHYRSQRSAVIVVTDDFAHDEIDEALTLLNLQPEFLAVRFVLALTESNHKIIQKAVQVGFRDVIALDIADTIWLQSFNFSTSSKPLRAYSPIPQVSLRNLCTVNLPVRIVWISKKEIHFEARLKTKPGERLKLKSLLGYELGSKWLSLKVLKHHSTNLSYRHSDAYTCSWEPLKSGTSEINTRDVSDCLDSFERKPPIKGFIAVSSMVLREQLLKRFSQKDIDLTVALQRKSIALEPKFLNPDFIFIEAGLTTGKNQDLLKELLANKNDRCPIYILGENASADDYVDLSEEQRKHIVVINRFQHNFTEKILSHVDGGRVPKSRHEHFYIPKDNILSFAEIAFSARLTQIHPYSLSLALPFSLPTYGMIGVSAPLLTAATGRVCYSKITATSYQENSEIDGFPYIVQCRLSDLVANERRSLAAGIQKLFEKHFYLGLDNAKSDEEKNDEQKHNNTRSDRKTLEMSVDLQSIAEEHKKHPEPVIELDNTEPNPKDLETLRNDVPISEVVSYRPPKKQFFASFKKYKRDLKVLTIILFVLVGIGYLVLKYRPTIQDGGHIFSEQLLKYQNRGRTSTPSP